MKVLGTILRFHFTVSFHFTFYFHFTHHVYTTHTHITPHFICLNMGTGQENCLSGNKCEKVTSVTLLVT